jgi:Spy/CpxP family protein refolding chaperone
MTMRALAAVFFLGSMLAVTSLSTAQPPGGEKKGEGKGGPGGKGGFGKGGFGGGFGGGPQIGQIMPTFVQEQLKLTDAQKKDLEAIQKEIDAKIEKMLTDDQKKTLKDLKERRPGGGFGGPGGGGNPKGSGGPGEKGGKGGGKGGNPPSGE